MFIMKEIVFQNLIKKKGKKQQDMNYKIKPILNKIKNNKENLSVLKKINK